MRSGTFRKAYIGISGADAALYLQYYPDEDLGTETGVFVSKVYEGSPAHLAGIQEQDVITALNDTKIDKMVQLTRVLFSYKPGDEVTIHLYRNRQELEVTLKLGTAPE